MQTWQEVLRTALVGTERQDIPQTPGDDPVSRLLAQVDRSSRERALLNLSAILACSRRAGYLLSETAEATPAPAEENDLPLCLPEAAQDLSLMLQGEFDELLPEWLTAVAGKGQRVPDQTLPDLLNQGSRNKELRAVILPVLGKRGRWLAAQNASWGWALQRSRLEIEQSLEAFATAEQTWQTGTRAERVALLRELRAADPERARQLLTSTWSQDPPGERALFLETFVVGLSMDDEPILESALDDRRKEVRRQASGLLSRLPDSQLCRRMFARVAPLLTITRKLLKDNLEVTPPAECDKAMQRDGIDLKPPQGIGEKGFWLVQMLSLIPPRLWSEHLARAPETLIQLAKVNQWGDNLLEGWTNAAILHRDAEWAEAALLHFLKRKGGQIPYNVEWKQAIPKERMEACILQLLQSHTGPLVRDHPAMTLFYEIEGYWGVELTRAFLDSLRRHKNQARGQMNYYVHYTMESLASFVPPEAAQEFGELWQEFAGEESYYANAPEKFLARVRLRQEMLSRIQG